MFYRETGDGSSLFNESAAFASVGNVLNGAVCLDNCKELYLAFYSGEEWKIFVPVHEWMYVCVRTR